MIKFQWLGAAALVLVTDELCASLVTGRQIDIICAAASLVSMQVGLLLAAAAVGICGLAMLALLPRLLMCPLLPA